MTKFLVRTVYLLRLLATPLIFLNPNTLKINIKVLLICNLILVLSSCNKNDSFGVEIQPENQNITGQHTDTLMLFTSTVFSDSIKTDELNGVSPLGTYIDPVFGTVQSSIFTQIRLAQSYDFRPDNGNGSLDSLVIDSIILYLALDGSYGEISSQVFEVYQLDSSIIKDSSSSVFTYSSTRSLSNTSGKKSYPIPSTK